MKVPREEAEAIIRAAWDAGVRHVDTALFYGDGAEAVERRDAGERAGQHARPLQGRRHGRKQAGVRRDGVAV